MNDGKSGSARPGRPLARRALLQATLAAGCVPLLRRQARAAFGALSDRTVTLMIGSDLGGGYDLFGRTLARHLERAVPGLRINVQNVGKAGGKLCARMLQEGPADGSVIALPPVSLLSAQLLGEEGVAYDISTWQWIGKLASESRLLIKGPGADFSGIADLRQDRPPATLSVRSTSSFAYYEALWLNAILGIRIKPVPGYKSGEKEAAVLAGEVMMTTCNYPDDLKILEAPGVQVVLQVNDKDIPSPYGDAPTLRELVGESGAYVHLERFLEANYDLARWLVAPPSIGGDILVEWRDAFDATVISPEFLAECKALDIQIAPLPGAEMSRRMGEVLADKDVLRQEMNAAFDCGKGYAEGLGDACRRS